MTIPAATQIFHIASSLERPVSPPAVIAREESGMTITVESPCTGRATKLTEFMKTALEFSGTEGAEHAARTFVEADQVKNVYTSIRIEHTPPARGEQAPVSACRHMNFDI